MRGNNPAEHGRKFNPVKPARPPTAGPTTGSPGWDEHDHPDPATRMFSMPSPVGDGFLVRVQTRLGQNLMENVVFVPVERLPAPKRARKPKAEE